jgi:hypothetical protein
MPTITQQAHKLIDSLPVPAGWDDVARVVDTAHFEAAVAEGIAAAEQGAFVSAAQMHAMYAKWGINVAT